MIALLGTTGKIGGAALKALADTPVRAVTRAVADLRDGEALSRALQGATGVLAILPFDAGTYSDLEALRASLLRGLSWGRPEHFVFISDYGAPHPSGTGIPAVFHGVEKQLLELGLGCTILRSAEHMQNWLRLPGVSFYPPGTPARPFVSAYDVGEIAARLLLEPISGTRVVHVEGPRRYELSSIGPLQMVPPDRRLATLQRAGLPAGLAQLLDQTYAAHGQGLIEVEPGGQFFRGTTTLDQVLGGG